MGMLTPNMPCFPKKVNCKTPLLGFQVYNILGLIITCLALYSIYPSLLWLPPSLLPSTLTTSTPISSPSSSTFYFLVCCSYFETEFYVTQAGLKITYSLGWP